MRAVKIVLAVLFILFIAAQFLPRHLPENTVTGESDIIIIGAVPVQVGEIIRNSCYDCHSMETNYPWYAYVAPSAWLVAKDIRSGRKELNFSIWEDYSVRNQIGMLDAIQKEVEAGKMPLRNYTAIHRKAKLDEDWTNDFFDTKCVEQCNPGLCDVGWPLSI